MKKGGKCIFSAFGIYVYFFLSWLKIYKIEKKRVNIFSLRRVPPHFSKFNLGKYINQEGDRGKNMKFKINIHPAYKATN